MNFCDYSFVREYFAMENAYVANSKDSRYSEDNEILIRGTKMTNLKINYKMIKNLRRGTPTDIPPYERPLRTL